MENQIFSDKAKPLIEKKKKKVLFIKKKKILLKDIV